MAALLRALFLAAVLLRTASAASYVTVDDAVVGLKLFTFRRLAQLGRVSLDVPMVQTVFLPSERGWSDLAWALGLNVSQLGKTYQLANAIINYHIIPNRVVRTGDFPFAPATPLTLTTATQDQTVDVYGVAAAGASASRRFFVNSYAFGGYQSTVLRQNIFTEQGIVHTIDSALVPNIDLLKQLATNPFDTLSAEVNQTADASEQDPDAPFVPPIPTVADFVSTRPELSYFTTMMMRANPAAPLNLVRKMTIFVPTNEALEAYVASIKQSMDWMLNRHPVYLSAVLSDLIVPGLTLAPADFRDLAVFTTESHQRVIARNDYNGTVVINSFRGSCHIDSEPIALGPTNLYTVDGLLLSMSR